MSKVGHNEKAHTEWQCVLLVPVRHTNCGPDLIRQYSLPKPGKLGTGETVVDAASNDAEQILREEGP